MITKEKIQKTIQSLPDNPEIELVIEKLILLDKIEQGIKDVNEGNVYTGEQVREKLGKWLK
jgi:predicted transcriptional regulator